MNNQIRLFVHDSGTVLEKYVERNQDLNLFLDSDTKSKSILDSYFKKRKRTDGAKWLINVPSSKYVSLSTFNENIKESFNNLTLDLDDDVYFYHSNTDQTIDISEAYKVSEEFEITVQKFGSWSQSNGFKISEPIKAWRRRDLQGKNFILTAMEHEHTLVLSKLLEGLKVKYQNQVEHKLNIEPLQFLSEIYTGCNLVIFCRSSKLHNICMVYASNDFFTFLRGHNYALIICLISI